MTKDWSVKNIPFECDQIYIGQTGRIIEDRWHCHLGYINQKKSAIAEHVTISYFKKQILHRVSNYRERLTKEANEIQITNDNFNRDMGISLSSVWKPALVSLMKKVTWVETSDDWLLEECCLHQSRDITIPGQSEDTAVVT